MTTVARITLRQYLGRIPIDAFTWGEAEELWRIEGEEVEAQMAAARSVCAREGHKFYDCPVGPLSDDRETRCVRCGELEAEGEEE